MYKLSSIIKLHPVVDVVSTMVRSAIPNEMNLSKARQSDVDTLVKKLKKASGQKTEPTLLDENSD